MARTTPVAPSSLSRQWSEELSELQHAAVLALGVLLVWTVYWVFFGTDPFWPAVRVGIVAATILGAVFYLRLRL